MRRLKKTLRCKVLETNIDVFYVIDIFEIVGNKSVEHLECYTIRLFWDFEAAFLWVQRKRRDSSNVNKIMTTALLDH